MPYNASKEKLIAHILDLDYVKAFQKAEDALQKEKEVFEQQSKMKELQKEAVLYQKIGKIQAFKETSNAAQRIHKSLKNDPLVEDYLLKMQPVDALLNYVTGEIESKVNEGSKFIVTIPKKVLENGEELVIDEKEKANRKVNIEFSDI